MQIDIVLRRREYNHVALAKKRLILSGRKEPPVESTLHDYPIYEIYATAESLGYTVEESHLGREQGPDMIVKNRINGNTVIIESEIGHNITSQSYQKFEREAKDYILTGKARAIIVITETPRRVWNKPLPNLKPRQNFYVVAGSVFKDVMPAMFVKLLG